MYKTNENTDEAYNNDSGYLTTSNSSTTSNLDTIRKRLTKYALRFTPIQTRLVKRLIEKEEIYLQNTESLRTIIDNKTPTLEDLDPYRITDLLQLMDYSLAQYNPIREEVIKLTRNQ